MNQKLTISPEEFQKIFPTNYYSSQGRHRAVDKFQKQSLWQLQTLQPLSMIYRINEKQLKMPQIPQRKQYNPDFEPVQNLINNNKEEHKRMALFNKVLSIKLRTTPQKKPNLIRSPFKQKDADENILQQLKALQDLEHQNMMKIRSTRKKILQQKSMCKFVRKVRSTASSPTKVTQQNQIANPETQRKSKFKILKDSEILPKINMNFLQKIKSESVLNRLNSHKLRKSSSNKKINMKNSKYPKQNNNRDWLKETQNMRQQYNNRQLFKYHDTLLFKKKHETILKEK